MKFDDGGDIIEEEDNFEVVTKTDTDIHIRMNPGKAGDDVADYPQNPYGERDTKNNSLFFEDGVRSVDFVLAWKKLVPSNDSSKSDALRHKELDEIEKKEGERTEKREVFEENLINEGLELERTVVDEEINFVKIHAPLEVLRRYAEILKLRLPMKEVSHVRLLIKNRSSRDGKFSVKKKTTDMLISTICEIVFCTCCFTYTPEIFV